MKKIECKREPVWTWVCPECDFTNYTKIEHDELFCWNCFEEFKPEYVDEQKIH